MNFKLVTGYLGPIDIPKWQNINCLRNYQYQYALPPNIVTKFSTFPGLSRSEGRNLNDNQIDKVDYKPDETRKLAYEILEHTLERFIYFIIEKLNSIFTELLNFFFCHLEKERMADNVY